MDFDKEHMQATGCGRYQSLDPKLLPRLWLVRSVQAAVVQERWSLSVSMLPQPAYSSAGAALDSTRACRQLLNARTVLDPPQRNARKAPGARSSGFSRDAVLMCATACLPGCCRSGVL
jgi:hypothetical protein